MNFFENCKYYEKNAIKNAKMQCVCNEREKSESLEKLMSVWRRHFEYFEEDTKKRRREKGKKKREKEENKRLRECVGE